VLGFDTDSTAVAGIEDDHVGVTAYGDGAFLGEEAEEFCGARTGAIDEAVKINAAAGDAVGVEKIDAFFDAGDAVRDVGEGVLAEQFLLEVEGAVVGTDGVDETEFEPVPQDILIVLFAQWRRHDVLHAFDAVAFGIRLVEDEMRKHGFDAQSYAA